MKSTDSVLDEFVYRPVDLPQFCSLVLCHGLKCKSMGGIQTQPHSGLYFYSLPTLHGTTTANSDREWRQSDILDDTAVQCANGVFCRYL